MILDNAVSGELVKKLWQKFVTAKYAQHAQLSEKFYADTGESYRCRFKRSTELEGDALFHSVGEELSRVLVEAGFVGNGIEAFAYKMSDGDFFREHNDSTNGTGFILYLTQKWRWDWGGLLMVEEGDRYLPVFPKFNRLVVIPKGRPHFVTQVMEYALDPRYALVGFIK